MVIPEKGGLYMPALTCGLVEKVQTIADPRRQCANLLLLTDFVVGKPVEKLSGMEARKSATLWSDEQHRSGKTCSIPWG
jgi:hypothetical protein